MGIFLNPHINVAIHGLFLDVASLVGNRILLEEDINKSINYLVQIKEHNKINDKILI